MPSTPLLIPPRRLVKTKGWFAWPDGATLASPRAVDALPLEQLRQSLRSAGVMKTRVKLDAAGDAAFRLRRDPTVTHREGYRLTITTRGVELLARTDAGAYYGVQTLRDLLTVHGRKLPTCRIDDTPDFDRRAIYHDCSRGKVPTLDTLKGLIEKLAHWKINEFQLYVENTFKFTHHPTIGRGFDPYTPADIHAIQAHCQLHHIRFVGSMASLGHMELILNDPRYQSLGELPGYMNYPGGTTLCPTDPGSIKLLAELYGEYLPLFDAQDFNACGDEPWELGQGRSRARTKRIGEGRVYLDFMLKVHRVCASHGKRMNAWADIALKHPELLKHWPQDTVLLNWNYDPKGKFFDSCKQIAESERPFMVCPGTHGWGSHGTRLDWAMTNVNRFTAAGRKYHAQGVLHTDWGDNGHRNTLGVSLLSMAHAAAHAWHGKAVDDDTFPQTYSRVCLGARDGKLAEAIVKLGKIYHDLDDPVENYLSLRAGLIRGRRRRLLRVDHAKTMTPMNLVDHDQTRLEQAVEIASSLNRDTAWPVSTKELDGFDRLTLADYRLAAMQDAVCLQRLLLGVRHQAGKRVPASHWKRLADDLRALGRAFDRNWLTRNRPSRLWENQALITHAVAECRTLAKTS